MQQNTTPSCQSYVYTNPLKIPGAQMPGIWPGGQPINHFYRFYHPQQPGGGVFPVNSDGQIIGPECFFPNNTPPPCIKIKPNPLPTRTTGSIGGGGGSTGGGGGTGGGGSKGGGCFVKDTLISTANGMIPIEHVKEGDAVYSYDFESKKEELKPVEEIFISERDQIIVLDFGAEKIRCTPPHKFYTGEWVAAFELKVGDSIMDIKGQWNKIQNIQHEVKLQQVINFRVNKNHNYFVGKMALLVHNDKLIYNDYGRNWGNGDGDPDYLFNTRF